MTMLSWIVFEPAEIAAARALDGPDARIGGRVLDGPGAGIPTDRLVVDARVLADPAYARWHEMLAALPTAELDTDAIFAPPSDADA